MKFTDLEPVLKPYDVLKFTLNEDGWEWHTTRDSVDLEGSQIPGLERCLREMRAALCVGTPLKEQILRYDGPDLTDEQVQKIISYGFQYILWVDSDAVYHHENLLTMVVTDKSNLCDLIYDASTDLKFNDVPTLEDAGIKL